jgi:hypothetical protein
MMRAAGCMVQVRQSWGDLSSTEGERSDDEPPEPTTTRAPPPPPSLSGLGTMCTSRDEPEEPDHHTAADSVRPPQTCPRVLPRSVGMEHWHASVSP